MEDRDAQFDRLVREATADPDVLGLYVFGSRGRVDGLADDRSDYDVAVVLRDRPGVLAEFDARWPYAHGAPVEVTRITLSEMRDVAEYGSSSEWSRPLYGQVRLVLDKTGEVARVLDEKRRVPAAVRPGLVRQALGAYVNSTYRSLRYGMVGATEGARLDAAESVPPLLTAIFAIDGRVRPFNKYLASELRSMPLQAREWRAEILLPRLMAVLTGDVEEQHALFRSVHDVAGEAGFGDVIDEWEPDVAWLRGEAAYRPAQ